MSSESKPKSKRWIRDLNLTGIGWELALPIFGGVILGYQLDRYFNSQYLLTLLLLGLGIAIGYYSLYKYIEIDVLRNKVAKLNKGNKDNNQ